MFFIYNKINLSHDNTCAYMYVCMYGCIYKGAIVKNKNSSKAELYAKFFSHCKISLIC